MSKKASSCFRMTRIRTQIFTAQKSNTNKPQDYLFKCQSNSRLAPVGNQTLNPRHSESHAVPVELHVTFYE